MASRILGIDLGAYSVKVAVANPGFRSATIVDFFERPVPPGDEPHEVRAARVVGQILRENNLTHDTPYAAISGDQVYIHVIEFPFKSLKRADLAKAVGTELEGRLPIDLDEMAFDFEPLPRSVAAHGNEGEAEPGGDEPAFAMTDHEVTAVAAAPVTALHGPIAPPAEGMRVLACASRRDRTQGLIDRLAAEGAEPRGLIAAPSSYVRVAERIEACETSKSGGPYVAVIDLGHARTDVCVVIDQRADYAWTIARGGRDLTAAIARAWRLPVEEAENAKHQEGFIASQSLPARSEQWSRIHRVLHEELAPLARDLRRTLSACRAKTGATVTRAVIVGGGARLNGMAEFLSEELRMPVTRMAPEDANRLLGDRLANAGVPADIACLAAGVAFEGASGRPAFDVRKGGMSYRADLSFLRAKAPQLAIAAIAVIGFAAASAMANLHKLRKAEEVLDRRVAEESQAAFGQPLDAESVLLKVGPAVNGKQSPIPEVTAYDLLLAFNKSVPSKEDVTIDIEKMDIKLNKIHIKKGVSAPTQADDGSEKNDGLQGVKLLEKSLKESDCFKEFEPPAIRTGKDETREFSLTIEVKCEEEEG